MTDKKDILNSVIKTPSAIAHALFPKTRTAVLQVLFSNAGPTLHLREVARLARVTPAMASKELGALVAVGLIGQRRDGNRLLFHANRESPVYEELASLMTKTAGVAGVVLEQIRQVAGIELAFIFGSVANASDHSSSDIDLMVIGDVSYGDLYLHCAEATLTLRRQVNVLIYSRQEVNERLTRDSSFLRGVQAKPRIPLIGSAEEITALLGASATA